MNSREFYCLEPRLSAIISDHQAEIPVPLGRLARELGLKVLAATLPAGTSGELRPQNGEFVIRVNRHDSPERQRFTVAHEIAHYLLHRDQVGEGIMDDALYRSGLSDRREAEANRLAADLVMPAQKVKEAARLASLNDASDVVNRLAREFKVSEAAMRIRLDQLQGG